MIHPKTTVSVMLLIELCTLRILKTDLYVPDTEIQKITPVQRETYLFIHFEINKWGNRLAPNE